jgi:hypothetical protein
VQDYLGMTLDFSKPGEVMVLMIDYVKGIIHDAPKEKRGLAASHKPSISNLSSEPNPTQKG